MATQMWQEIQDQPEVALRLVQDQAERIRTCRRELQGVGRLILAGTGASLAACRAGQYAFMKYAGLIPHVLPAAELGYVAPDPGTLVVLVSQSGESLETKEAVRMLQDRSIRVWGITNNPNSYLAVHSDRVLLMQAGAEVSSATKTYLATLVLFFLLAGGEEGARQIPADARATLDAAQAPVDRWAAELQDQDVAYILGMGTLGVTAAQGALMMKEKTWKHVEGLSLSEFRHGNIEVVRPGLPLLVLATTPALAAEAVRHADYFASLGATVYLVTDAPVASDRIPPERILQVCNRGDEVTGQVAAVIPLQLLAERVAVLKGYDVDGFRYIAKVVDKYTL